MARLKTAILISGRGSNLQSLIDHFGPGVQESPVEIELVLSNKADALGLKRAEAAGIPTKVIDHKSFGSRADFDTVLDREIRASGAEFICLAGFTRLLTNTFIEVWRDRMINIHPSLLPSFKGLDTHRRALKRGVRFHGCTVHFVRNEMDTGPIIAQAAVPILATDDADSLAARVLKAEHRLYPLALRLVAEGKVRVENEVVIIKDAASADATLFNPLDV